MSSPFFLTYLDRNISIFLLHKIHFDSIYFCLFSVPRWEDHPQAELGVGGTSEPRPLVRGRATIWTLVWLVPSPQENGLPELWVIHLNWMGIGSLILKLIWKSNKLRKAKTIWRTHISQFQSVLQDSPGSPVVKNPPLAPPGEVTLFGNRVLADDQIKMRSLGWALIQ